MMRVRAVLGLMILFVGCIGFEDTVSKESRMSRAKVVGNLTQGQYQVTKNCATENAFKNAYWNNHDAGIYLDVVNGKPLFSSNDKFDSGTGWPSFMRPLDEKLLKQIEDRSYGMLRTEVKSKDSDAHLGHLFNDGPKPTGKRFCINSAALRFVNVLELEREGLSRYLPLFTPKQVEGERKKRAERVKSGEYKTALLAGGCFWGVQDLIRKISGVIETEVGYTGGTTPKPVYEEVKKGTTGHAEAVRILFDPKIVSFDRLLDFFFTMHDPTTLNRQGNDVGSQYRSAIFFADAEQEQEARRKIKEWDESGKWKKPIVTEVVKAQEFTSAEGYHQDYLVKNPGGYTCHYFREF